MLGWLALVVAALIGLFVLVQSHASSIEPAYAVLAAAFAAAVLAAMYLASLKARLGDRRWPQLAFAAALACAAGAGLWWFGKDHAADAIGNKFTALDDDRARRSQTGPVSVLIRRSPDGRFLAQGQINGTEASLLFDSGASVVMLKPTDAERAGISIKDLSFTIPVQTANGTVYAAPIRIRSIAVGLLKIEDLEALVAQPGSLNENLLGMSFLRRLTSYNLAGDFLTLRE
jgi:aspartyl protease family protein